MRFNRMLLATTLVIVALVIQVSVLARLHLPGAVPDLVLLTVVAFALVYGHVGGCLIGFGAGLLSDLVPPADHAAGRYALVLCVIGYVAGLFRPDHGRLLFTAAVYDLLLAPFVVPGIMALARRAENDPLAETSSTKAADVSSGWLSSGTGLRIGSQRGVLRVRAARARVARAGRIKGVKRL